MKLELSRQIFYEYSNIKFYENPFSGSRIVPCGRTDRRTHRHTDMTKLPPPPPHFVNALKSL